MAPCDEHLPISRRSDECRRAYYRGTTARYRKRHPTRSKASDLRIRYGLEWADYQQMLEEQNGLCAICKLPEPVSGRTLSVDHDHQTGAVRGLLCTYCNTALGKFRDSVELLERAKHYLLERG